MDSFKDHRGSVCLVNVINPSNKSVVVAQAPNVILWRGLGFRLRLELRCGIGTGWCYQRAFHVHEALKKGACTF